MDDHRWYYMIGEERKGPVEWDFLLKELGQGRLQENSLVWAAHLAEWSPLGEQIKARDKEGLPVLPVVSTAAEVPQWQPTIPSPPLESWESEKPKSSLGKKILIGVCIWIGVSGVIGGIAAIGNSSPTDSVKQVEGKSVGSRNSGEKSLTTDEFAKRWNAVLRVEGQRYLDAENLSQGDHLIAFAVANSFIKSFGNFELNNDGTREVGLIDFKATRFIGVASVDHASKMVKAITLTVPSGENDNAELIQMAGACWKLFAVNLLDVFQVETDGTRLNEANSLIREVTNNGGRPVQKTYHCEFGDCKVTLGVLNVSIELI
ncbi:MAG: domain 2 [Holophagaceae bacterium]|nr:domain 2 [Holophagaceae bacterium]